MMNLKGKIVTVIGAAKSGQSAAKLLVRLKARVQISEAAIESNIDQSFRRWIKRNYVSVEYGGHTQAMITKSDLVVLSPGVRIDAQPVRWAKAKKIPVWGEIELAAQLCKKPIIAITGSNGKTTVTTLIQKVIQVAGYKACLCGNIGNPFTRFIEDQKKYDYFVVEISSFQLETIVQFRPHIAVFLNFSQNHLDRHKDVKEYFNAKCRIFMNQKKTDYAVLNATDPRLQTLARRLKSRVRFFNAQEGPDDFRNPNFSAVKEVADILQLPVKSTEKVFKHFKGVEHRLERVRTLKGVEFINDSKSTTVEAGRWALQSFEQPIIMICGGRDKHLDFTVLVNLVSQKVKTMVVFGEAKQKLTQVFRRAVQVHAAETLQAAVMKAQSLAQDGDVILLSPMCTSFDMFKNFEDRGRQFKNIVTNLKS